MDFSGGGAPGKGMYLRAKGIKKRLGGRPLSRLYV